MCLPGAGRPDQEDVLPPVEILALHKFEQLRLVDAWLCREVELVEQLRGGELCRLEPPFSRLSLPISSAYSTPAVTSSRLNRSRSLSTRMNDRVPEFGSSASILRRSSGKQSGRFHCSNGFA
jgi:hypothetical protein